MFARIRSIFFAPDEPAGGAPVETAPVETAPAPAPGEVPAAPAAVGTEPAPAGGEPAPVVEAPDWGTKVTEWGGEDTVKRALAIDSALNTIEGQEALIRQGLQARGFNEAQIDAFLASNKPAPGPEVESVEDLLKDPDRQLTAGEIQRILEAREQQRVAQQSQQETIRTATTTIDTVLGELKVPDANRQTILTLADQFLPQKGVIPNDPAQIRLAIEKGAAEFTRQVQEEAKLLIEGKGTVAATLPTPLPAAGGGGTEAPSEPANLAEASKRVRERHGFATQA